MLRLSAVLYILDASAVAGAAVIAVLGRKIYNALQGPKPV
jgi:hypothetical protein